MNYHQFLDNCLSPETTLVNIRTLDISNEKRIKPCFGIKVRGLIYPCLVDPEGKEVVIEMYYIYSEDLKSFLYSWPHGSTC